MDFWLPVRGVAAEDADDAVNPTFDAARKVARLETRHNSAGNYNRGQCIRESAFKTITDFDANFVLCGSYQEQYTIVFLCFAKLPGSEETVGVGFNVAAL